MIHILKESVSSPESSIWTMQCGDQTIADDDGNTFPTTDFYLENEAHKATCPRCIIKVKLKVKVLELMK